MKCKYGWQCNWLWVVKGYCDICKWRKKMNKIVYALVFLLCIVSVVQACGIPTPTKPIIERESTTALSIDCYQIALDKQYTDGISTVIVVGLKNNGAYNFFEHGIAFGYRNGIYYLYGQNATLSESMFLGLLKSKYSNEYQLWRSPDRPPFAIRANEECVVFDILTIEELKILAEDEGRILNMTKEYYGRGSGSMVVTSVITPSPISSVSIGTNVSAVENNSDYTWVLWVFGLFALIIALLYMFTLKRGK